MSKLIDDNIVKIYMPYTCIVMTLDRYNKIYNSLSDNYVHGFNYYLEMIKNLSGVIEVASPPLFIPDSEIPEA